MRKGNSLVSRLPVDYSVSLLQREEELLKERRVIMCLNPSLTLEALLLYNGASALYGGGGPDGVLKGLPR